MSLQVDDAFVLDVMAKVDDARYPIDIMNATLAVAAERGLVVPDDAPRMWALFNGGKLNQVCRTHTLASDLKMDGETVVRVAVVEIKE